MVSYRKAVADDAVAIVDVKKVVWPDETSDINHITSTIDRADHVTHVAIDDNQIIGFVDGFLTTSPFGVLRWEVDLLVVHPKYRKQGIAKELINQSTMTGKEKQAKFSRALIRLGNVSSMQAFTSCQFTLQDGTYGLYVSSEPAERPNNYEQFSKYLIPVYTFAYKGIWLEKKLTEDTLQAAKYKRQQDDLDIAGVIIPTTQANIIRMANTAGYTPVGQYCWWQFDF